MECSLVAGGSRGFADGKGDRAQFDYPSAIALDHEGNAYVMDTNNFCVRKVTRDGAVTTFAGVPRKSGFLDGEAEEALFGYCYGICVAPDRTLYVPDASNNAVRRVREGKVSTLGGSFSNPYAVAAGKDGSVYVGDNRRLGIFRVSEEGDCLLFAGLNPSGIRDGPLQNCEFYCIYHIVLDGEDLYVADKNTLRRIRSGAISTILQDQCLGITSVQKGRDGFLYYVSPSSPYIKRVQLGEKCVAVPLSFGLSGPCSVAADLSGIWVVDRERCAVKFASTFPEWSTSVHWQFSKSIRDSIRVMMMLRTKKTELRRLPKEIALVIAKFVADW